MEKREREREENTQLAGGKMLIEVEKLQKKNINCWLHYKILVQKIMLKTCESQHTIAHTFNMIFCQNELTQKKTSHSCHYHRSMERKYTA